MALLRKTIIPYEARFAERGYNNRVPGERGRCFMTKDGRAITYDRMKTGTLRCFLSLGVPIYLDAETPWWQTHHNGSLESAVADSWDFMQTVGFSFLDRPERMTVTQWRERHNLLVRDHRKSVIHVTWPSSWPLNQIVMAAKRAIPGYQRFAALEVRHMLEGRSSIDITDLSLLQAKELLPVLLSHQFTAEVIQI